MPPLAGYEVFTPPVKPPRTPWTPVTCSYWSRTAWQQQRLRSTRSRCPNTPTPSGVIRMRRKGRSWCCTPWWWSRHRQGRGMAAPLSSSTRTTPENTAVPTCAWTPMPKIRPPESSTPTWVIGSPASWIVTSTASPAWRWCVWRKTQSISLTEFRPLGGIKFH